MVRAVLLVRAVYVRYQYTWGHPADLHGQVAGRTVGWPGVQVAASRGNRFMAQGRLHKVDRAASVEGVAGVGVSEPVGADPRPYPNPTSRRSDCAEDLRAGGRRGRLNRKFR